MEFNNKIDVQAEKSILNESILGSLNKPEFNMPSEGIPKIDFGIPEMMGSSPREKSPFSTENMASISAIPSNINFDSSVLTGTNSYTASPLNINDPLTPPPVVGSPAEFKKITPTEDPYEKAKQQTQNLQKLLNTEVMPNIQKIASTVSDMSVKQKNQSSMTEERPTIPPTNLIFFDRSARTSSPPAWA